jgi:hypothetical protein
MPGATTNKRIVRWREYILAKTAGSICATAGGSLLLFAWPVFVLALMSAVIMAGLFLSDATRDGYRTAVDIRRDSPTDAVVCALVSLVSAAIIPLAGRMFNKGNAVANVTPVSNQNIHLLPDQQTLVRGSNAEDVTQNNELLRPAEEATCRAEELLRAGIEQHS